MSMEHNHKVITDGPEQTMMLGELLGQKCRGGELFLLSSDLGGGKTAFAKGIARGMGSKEVVTSPTFTVSNVYNSDRGIEIHHFDFYRLSEGGMVEHELAEIINDPNIVIVVEWGDVVDGSLPVKKVVVEISRLATGENHRQISITIPDSLSYLRTES